MGRGRGSIRYWDALVAELRTGVYMGDTESGSSAFSRAGVLEEAPSGVELCPKAVIQKFLSFVSLVVAKTPTADSYATEVFARQ